MINFDVIQQKEELNYKLTIQNLLTGFNKTRHKYLESQRETADDINVLNILDFTYDEIRHSKFIAWLLSADETHAQGNIFFKLFLEALDLPNTYAEVQYYVKKEVARDESRIDIEIASTKESSKAFVVHIENKVGAILAEEQINREYNDLKKAAIEKGVAKEDMHGFIISIDEPDFPVSKYKFRWVSWQKIAGIIYGFINRAKAVKTQWVASQYLECIEKNIIRKRVEFNTKREEE